MPEQNYDELRASERHAIDLAVEVSPVSDQQESFCDKTALMNVSGGGVCFSTFESGLYAIGQKLCLKVCLPGTDELDACMECKARVVWMHVTGQVDKEARKQMLIGVCLDGFMSFESHQQEQLQNIESGEAS